MAVTPNVATRGAPCRRWNFNAPIEGSVGVVYLKSFAAILAGANPFFGTQNFSRAAVRISI